MEKKYEMLCELCDYIEDELECLNEKIRRSGKGMSSNDAEWAEHLTNTMHNIEKMKERHSMDGMSGRRRSRDNYYDRTHYTRDDSRHEFIEELEDLMRKAPDEHTRMKIERMLNDMK